MSRVVSFTQMKDGTAEDYELLGRLESQEMRSFPDRVLGWLRTLQDSAGYQVTRLEHCLQAATRAHRAGEDEETVVCVLLHDIGDHLAPANHSEVAAAILRPFVSERNHWIVKHHGVFQGYYYFQHVGMDPNARDKWLDHPCYQATVDFCENYDQVSFDPAYDSEPLTFFEPMVRRILDQTRRHDNLAERLPSPIDAERLVLTPLRVDDADEMVGVLSSPELYTHIGGEPPTLDALRRRYADLVVGHSPDGEQEWLNWVVRLQGDGAAVGTVQATVIQEDGRAEVAWIIGADRQGHGYGSEAAAALVHALTEAGVSWVIAHVYPDHAASEAVARACGLAPSEHFHDGERRWEWRSDGRNDV